MLRRRTRCALRARTIRTSSQHRPRRAAIAALLAAALGITGLVAGPQVIGQAAAKTVAGSPFGAAEHMWFTPGGMRFSGWAIDPGTSAPLYVYVTVDNARIGAVIANAPRADIGARFPRKGPNHGFSMTLPISEGTHTVCVWARNAGRGANTALRCQTRTMDYGPIGALDSLRTGPGSLYVKGWAYDADKPSAPITISVVVDGRTTSLVADAPRPDVAKKAPSAGAAHGFELTLPASQGAHSVCVNSTNIGFGTDNILGCKTLTLAESPLGAIDSAAPQSGKLRIRGWAFDPDRPTTPITTSITVDGVRHDILASYYRTDVGAAHAGTGNHHGYDLTLTLPEASHSICVVARNVSFGSDSVLGCRTVVLNFTPATNLYTLSPTATGISVSGWAADPDTSAAISVRLTVDGRASTLTANQAGTSHNGHRFRTRLVLTSGTHTICATGLNVLFGHNNSPAVCHTLALALNPIAGWDHLGRAAGSSNLAVGGWAFDPDTHATTSVTASVDGQTVATFPADTARSDIGALYPAWGNSRGFASTITADDSEHTVCLTAKNVSGGTDTALGCHLIIAVHPVAPSAPSAATALPGYGAATITWARPTSDGGAPWTKYVVTARPGGQTATVAAGATTATISGLKTKTSYTFTVVAVNIAGTSPAVTSNAITTQTGPPPQRTPAPVSTSRYIRNVRGSSSSELTTMRNEGLSDARANPTGHAYMVLLDIGGQDQIDGGVVLSATTRFVAYGDLSRDLNAYVDGYHSGQRASAPVTIAVGTNNDMDVSGASGAAWATRVVNPLASYARRYSGITVAGANDIEPGFRGSYSQSRSWLTGYLGATRSPFVFNGSADGCAWTVTDRSCNNGWSMAGLYNLAMGAAPTRSLNLPQIYNSTMAGQWKYISLTGVGNGQPRINFGGPLTEWTACSQSGGCGSLTGRSAWSMLWSNLQSDSRLKVGSLPYSTDLRIDQ